MGLIARIRSRFARNDPVQSVVAGLFPKWQANKPLWPCNDYRILADEGYRRNVVIYGCVRVISDSTAEPKIIVMKRQRDGTYANVSKDHPLVTLLSNPNPDQSFFEFMELVVTHLQVSGNAYIHEVRSQAGRVVELRTLRPDRIKVVPDEIGRIMGYAFSYSSEAGGHIVLPVADVIHMKLPDPLDDYYGLSPIAVAAGIADMDINATDYLRAFFLNAGEPSGLLKFKVRTDKEERQRLQEMWRDQHGMNTGFSGGWGGLRSLFAGSVGGWHSISVLDSDVEYQEIGSRPGKLGLDSIFGVTESRICSAFGVPAVVVGVKIGLDRSTYANFETAVGTLWEQTLRPMYRRMGEKLTMDLASEFGQDLRITFSLEDVQALQESAQAKRQFAIDGWDKGMLRLNEARAIVGQPALDGGDVLKEWATAVFMSEKESPGQANRQKPITFVREAQSKPNGNGHGHGNGNTPKIALAGPVSRFDEPMEPGYKALHRIADAAAPGLKQAFLEAVAKLANPRVLRNVEGAIASGDLDAATEAIPWDKVAFSKLDDFTKAMILGIAEKAGIAAEAIQPKGLNIRFDLTNPMAAQWAAEHSGELITQVGDESRAAVRSYIATALSGGTSAADTAAELGDVVGLTERDAGAVARMRETLSQDPELSPVDVDQRVSDYADQLLDARADMIARQETMIAANKGQEILWDQAIEAGILDKETAQRVWIATEDDITCPFCGAMDGVTTGLGQPWETEEGPVDTPQDIHPQCRCTEGLVWEPSQ